VKVNRHGLPNFQAYKLSQNEEVSFHTDVLLTPEWKWKDKENVYIISNIHRTEMTTIEKVNYQTDRQIAKPISVQDYNDNKGLVDQSEMQMSFSESAHKSLKWYKKFFFDLLDVSFFNAYVLYKL
jgi:hypothetical protein